MRAYGNRILIEPIDSEKERLKQFSITLPDGREEAPDMGRVISIGPLVDIVKEGDTVIFQRHAPTTVEMDGKKYLFAVEEDILAKVEL